MKRALKQLALTAVFWAVAWAAVVEEIQGARYLLGFFVWAFYLPLMLLAQAEKMQRSIAADPPNPIWSKALGRASNWGTLLVLVWHGWIATGLAWALGMVLSAVANLQIDKFRKEANRAAE